MVQPIATASGTGSKKYNMKAAVKDLLKASEERSKAFERSMEIGWSLIAKLVEKLDSRSRVNRGKDEGEEDKDDSENEEDKEPEPRGKSHKRVSTKAKKSHRQSNKKAREGCKK